ncbi:hypothetical protein AB986_04905 [Alkalihalobacillus macyae]|uniref:HTH cro/C1-type domain-containing protein n=2 Tax=Guptibacillus hwajinpoensis TaxID=208199 RepID=A0A0J6CZY6_9BACL|nr:hypothetical protein AB986_04905 [Alkalihalobacillus macyae]
MDMATFGIRLKELRKSKRITQKELSRILKLSESAVSMYERDEREPSFETLKALSELFEVSRAYLLGDTDDPQHSSNNSDKNYDSLSEINKILTDLGVTDFFMHNIEDWKDLNPEQVDELRRDFESFLEYKAFEAKKMKKEAKKDSTKDDN